MLGRQERVDSDESSLDEHGRVPCDDPVLNKDDEFLC